MFESNRPRPVVLVLARWIHRWAERQLARAQARDQTPPNPEFARAEQPDEREDAQPRVSPPAASSVRGAHDELRFRPDVPPPPAHWLEKVRHAAPELLRGLVAEASPEAAAPLWPHFGAEPLERDSQQRGPERLEPRAERLVDDASRVRPPLTPSSGELPSPRPRVGRADADPRPEPLAPPRPTPGLEPTKPPGRSGARPVDVEYPSLRSESSTRSSGDEALGGSTQRPLAPDPRPRSPRQRPRQQTAAPSPIEVESSGRTPPADSHPRAWMPQSRTDTRASLPDDSTPPFPRTRADASIHDIPVRAHATVPSRAFDDIDPIVPSNLHARTEDIDTHESRDRATAIMEAFAADSPPLHEPARASSFGHGTPEVEGRPVFRLPSMLETRAPTPASGSAPAWASLPAWPSVDSAAHASLASQLTQAQRQARLDREQQGEA